MNFGGSMRVGSRVAGSRVAGATAALLLWGGMASVQIAEVQAFDALPEPAVAIVPERTVDEFLDCVRGRATLVSAHRGGPVPGYPENAVETFARTLAAGPMLIETDVRRTADGVLVLLHDEDLDRTTTGSGTLSEMTWAEIQDFRLLDNDGMETPFAIPRLDTALDWAEGRGILQLDVKRNVPHDQVVALVAEKDARARAMIIVYNAQDAADVAAADPRITISASIYDAEDLAALEAAGVDRDRLVGWTGTREPRPGTWHMLARHGITANYGTLWDQDEAIAESGDDSRYAELAAMGADLIATDRHLAAQAALDAVQDTAAVVEACSAAD